MIDRKHKNVMNNRESPKGQSLVELLVAIGIFAILLPALYFGFISTTQGKAQQEQRAQAVALLKEAQEAVRSVRDGGWTTFAVDGTFHPVASGSAWTLVSGPETINAFTRQVVISDVQRDVNGNIVPSGVVDSSTKLVTTTVSWTLPIAGSTQSVMYLTRHNDLTYLQTTQADFNAGTNTNTSVLATVPSIVPNDGEVELAAGGGGDWCKPGSNVVTTFDLPGSGVVQSITATSGATKNVAYTTTGGNASGDAVDGLSISHASPPVVTNPSSNDDAKAYGIFVDNAGSYVYFNENNPPNHTVQITNASNLSDVGYFDVNHATGISIYVLGNTGYTTVGSTLYSFDVSSKTGSRPQLGSVGLSGTGNRVIVVGTNAYVATANTTSQMQIIDVSDPRNMKVEKSINLGNGLGGVDLSVNSSQTYAYVVTSYASGKNDFFIVDLQNTNNIYGYLTVNGMNPKALAIVSGNRAILVGSGGEEYEVFNIANPSAAVHCGGMSPAGVTTINAVAPVIENTGNAYAYILTDNASAEFQIVLGGSGGQFSTSGTFESSTFDPGYQSAFNRLIADIAQPASTTIQMQVASEPAINGSCNGVSSYAYVGPNGNTSTYFTPSGSTISAIIPYGTYGNYQNPARCFRYKVWFSTTDSSLTPILYDALLNYSP